MLNNNTALSAEVLLVQSCSVTGWFSRVQGLSLGKRTFMEKIQMWRRCPIKRTLSLSQFWDDGAQEEMLGTVTMTHMIPKMLLPPRATAILAREWWWRGQGVQHSQLTGTYWTSGFPTSETEDPRFVCLEVCGRLMESCGAGKQKGKKRVWHHQIKSHWSWHGGGGDSVRRL